MMALASVIQETEGNYFVCPSCNITFFLTPNLMFCILPTSRLDFQDSNGEMSSHDIISLPSNVRIMNRFKLLRFFADYMDENLKESSNNQINSTPCLLSQPFVKRWVRTTKVMIMQLDNNTLQVHTIHFFQYLVIFSIVCLCFICVDQLFQGPCENHSFCFEWAFLLRSHRLLGDAR